MQKAFSIWNRGRGGNCVVQHTDAGIWVKKWQLVRPRGVHNWLNQNSGEFKTLHHLISGYTVCTVCCAQTLQCRVSTALSGPPV